MLECSIFELRNTVTELEKSLKTVGNEGKWITTVLLIDSETQKNNSLGGTYRGSNFCLEIYIFTFQMWLL